MMLKTYIVTYRPFETTETVEIKAKSKVEAMDKVEQGYGWPIECEEVK